jgi:hypothetical protein
MDGRVGGSWAVGSVSGKDKQHRMLRKELLVATPITAANSNPLLRGVAAADGHLHARA